MLHVSWAMGPNFISMLTYTCDLCLGDLFSFLPMPLSSPYFTTDLHILGAKDPYPNGPRNRQSMFDEGLAELDKALSDTAGGVEVRLRKDLSNLPQEAGQCTNKQVDCGVEE